MVIDEDQGKSSATAKTRTGFARLLAAVAGGEAGIVIALEVTRLARNSPDWHHLIYLCRFTGTLIADEQTVYDPALSADRMVLGIRGQMGELELESSIARMVNARWNKAERGELITIPPPGYDVDEFGELVQTCDEAVAHAIGTVFEKFAELGSARQVFLVVAESGAQVPGAAHRAALAPRGLVGAELWDGAAHAAQPHLRRGLCVRQERDGPSDSVATMPRRLRCAASSVASGRC